MSYVAVISWTYQYIVECPIEAASSTAILQLVRPIFIKVEPASMVNQRLEREQ